jgi:hypothetical protein
MGIVESRKLPGLRVLANVFLDGRSATTVLFFELDEQGHWQDNSIVEDGLLRPNNASRPGSALSAVHATHPFSLCVLFVMPGTRWRTKIVGSCT